MSKFKNKKEFDHIVNCMNFELEDRDLVIGQHVYYIPNHIKIDSELPLHLLESGIISSMNSSFVFVRFFKTSLKTGVRAYSETSQACKKENLYPLNFKSFLIA